MNPRRLSHLIFLILVSGLFACDKGRIYEEYREIPDAVWNRNNILSYDVNITDTISSSNILIGIRNKGNYAYCNIFLFVTITSPDQKTVRDTFQCYLADDAGKWYGSGIGDIYDNRFIYKKNVKFPKKGNYHFRIEQAMRVENLSDISDVGLRIARPE